MATATLGASATGMYSHRVWLWQVPIILTVDTQADWDGDNGLAEKNCVEVEFDAPISEAVTTPPFVSGGVTRGGTAGRAEEKRCDFILEMKIKLKVEEARTQTPFGTIDI